MWGRHVTLKISDSEVFLSEGTARTKLEKSMRERRPSDRPKLRSSSWGGPGAWYCYRCFDMVYFQTGAYHNWLLRGPRSSWKCQMHMLAPNQWMEARVPCYWIVKELEKAEEADGAMGTPSVSADLDLCDLSDTKPSAWQHMLVDMRPLIHMQQRLACSCLNDWRCN